LKFFQENGLRIGLATSSYDVLIQTILSTLGIRDYFQTVHSAEYEMYGKPHPAVYLSAAQQLGVDPKKCLVVEDSLNGIVSAKAARMTVICVPEKTHIRDPRLILADAEFESLTDVVHYFQKHA
jgi:sugar-phosphatase